MVFPNIRNLREDNDKKQAELANYLNVKQTTYSKYELGKINIPIEIFLKLADYYDVSVDYLLGRTKEKSLNGSKTENHAAKILLSDCINILQRKMRNRMCLS